MTAVAPDISDDAALPANVAAHIQRNVRRHPDRPAFVWLDGRGSEEVNWTFNAFWSRVTAVAHALRRKWRAAEGEHVLLVYERGPEFLAAFIGCLLAGCIAVPVYPPVPADLERGLAKLAKVAELTALRLVLTSSKYNTLRRMLVLKAKVARKTSHAWPSGLTWAVTDTLPLRSAAQHFAPASVAPDDPAFVQFTSGSTGDPKGVVITHANIIANMNHIKRAVDAKASDVVVAWVPLYHDLGLVGMMVQNLILGATVVMMSPLTFLRSPYVWLKAITDYKARFTAAPNFAYELCVRKISPEQRKALHFPGCSFLNCAEPVRADTIRRFAEAFGECGFVVDNMKPFYGMAEATLYMSGGTPKLSVLKALASSLTTGSTVKVLDPDQHVAHSSELVGCGRPAAGTHVLAVHPETRMLLPPDTVGELWVASPSVAIRYHGRAELTTRDLKAQLADEVHVDACEPSITPGTTFLRTGDLGFLHEGEVFICGRLKNTLIIGGKNHYPQDIEATCSDCTSFLRPGCSVVFSVPDPESQEENVVIVAEIRDLSSPRAEIVKAMRTAVSLHHGLQCHDIVLIPPRTLPKTTSGKPRHRFTRELYMAGKISAVFSLLQDMQPARSRQTDRGPAGCMLASRQEYNAADVAQSVQWFFELVGALLPAAIDPSILRDLIAQSHLPLAELVATIPEAQSMLDEPTPVAPFLAAYADFFRSNAIPGEVVHRLRLQAEQSDDAWAFVPVEMQAACRAGACPTQLIEAVAWSMLMQRIAAATHDDAKGTEDRFGTIIAAASLKTSHCTNGHWFDSIKHRSVALGGLISPSEQSGQLVAMNIAELVLTERAVLDGFWANTALGLGLVHSLLDHKTAFHTSSITQLYVLWHTASMGGLSSKLRIDWHLVVGINFLPEFAAASGQEAFRARYKTLIMTLSYIFRPASAPMRMPQPVLDVLHAVGAKHARLNDVALPAGETPLLAQFAALTKAIHPVDSELGDLTRFLTADDVIDQQGVAEMNDAVLLRFAADAVRWSDATASKHAEPSSVDLQSRLLGAIREALELSSDPDMTDSLQGLGMSSMQQVELSAKFSSILGHELGPDVVASAATVRDLLDALVEEDGGAGAARTQRVFAVCSDQAARAALPRIDETSASVLPIAVVGLLQLLGLVLICLIVGASVLPSYHFLRFVFKDLSDPWASLPAWGGATAFGLLVPLAIPMFLMSLSSAVILAKWLLIGRYREGCRKLHTLYFVRWWLVDRLVAFWESYVGIFIGNTVFLTAFYKLCGARIAWTASIKAAMLREFDLHEIGSFASVGGTVLARELSSSHGLTFAKTRIEAHATVRGRSFVGAGCTIEEHARLLHGTVLLPFSRAAAHTVYEGNPAYVVSEHQCSICTHGAASGEIKNDFETIDINEKAVAVDELSKQPVTSSNQGSERKQVLRRIALEAGKAMGMFATLYIFFLSSTYASSLFWEAVGTHDDFRYMALVYWITSYVIAGFCTATLAIALKWLLLGRVQPGLFTPTVWRDVAVFLVDLHQRIVILVLARFCNRTTLVQHWWMRAYGAKISNPCTSMRLPLISASEADLFEFGSAVFVSSAWFFAEDADRSDGRHELTRITVKRGAEIGVNCIVGPNVVVGEDSILGIDSTVRHEHVQAGTFRLGRNCYGKTTEVKPGAQPIKMHSWTANLLSVVVFAVNLSALIPAYELAVALLFEDGDCFWNSETGSYLAEASSLNRNIAVMLCGLCIIAVIVSLGFLQLVHEKSMWGFGHDGGAPPRWMWHYPLYQDWACARHSTFVFLLQGSVLYVLYLRMLGARVASSAVVMNGPIFETKLVRMGEGATVDEGARVIGHVYTSAFGGLYFSHVEVEPRASVMPFATVWPETTATEGLIVHPHQVAPRTQRASNIEITAKNCSLSSDL
eukprot:m.274499 g.274499  ORF g.274499 m.274499 type:complete len:1902 (+) comp11091_c1_seq8:214-5919(+)